MVCPCEVTKKMGYGAKIVHASMKSIRVRNIRDLMALVVVN